MNNQIIMAWTVMPITIVAKAWTDNTFKTALLGDDPNSVLRNQIMELPWDFNFIITEDTGSQRNLPLPNLPTDLSSWTEEQVLDVLIKETYGDVNFQYYLPARVINKSFFDSNYKTQLLSDADTALSSEGYTPQGGQTFTVLENSSTNRNLILPKIPESWVGLSYRDILDRLISEGQQIVENANLIRSEQLEDTRLIRTPSELFGVACCRGQSAPSKQVPY